MQTVRFYGIGESVVRQSKMRAKFDHRAAVLAYAFSADAPWAYSGGLDTSDRERVSRYFWHLKLTINTS